MLLQKYWTKLTNTYRNIKYKPNEVSYNTYTWPIELYKQLMMEKLKIQDKKNSQHQGCNDGTDNPLVSANPSGHRSQDFLTLIDGIIDTMKLQKKQVVRRYTKTSTYIYLQRRKVNCILLSCVACWRLTRPCLCYMKRNFLLRNLIVKGKFLMPLYLHAEASGAVGANLQGLKYQALLSPMQLSGSPWFYHLIDSVSQLTSSGDLVDLRRPANILSQSKMLNQI